MKLRKGTRAIGQHSCASADWGTDGEIVDLGRQVLGRFDIDPASSPKWNRVIGAARIIGKAENGTRTPWVEGAPAPHQLVAKRRLAKPTDKRAIVNSPTEPSGELLAKFWRATAGYYELGWLAAALWVGFSVEQLARLQRVGAASHPLQHVTLVPCRRRRYLKRPGVAGKQPGHASFVTLLPSCRAEVARFVELASPLGHVIVGDRWRR